MRPDDRPDIFVLSIDTMRRDAMAPYGNDSMPTASKLRCEGVAFERCLSTSPWTGASFGSMFTGLWPREHGCLAHTPCRSEPQKNPKPLRPDVRRFTEMLKAGGYFTVAAQGNPG